MQFITLILSLLISAVCFCQAKNDPLVLNKVQSSTFSTGETHTYSLLSVGDQFIQIRVEQDGIDVKITAVSPDGKRLGIFDSPNGKNGPELVTLALKEKGNYTFDIEPLVKATVSGNYTIELQTLDPLGKTPTERIDQMMFLNTSETPGASISVMKEGELVFSKGYGMANLEYLIPVDNSTIFHIASISKQFTAFSILLLAEDGKLNIDDDIRKYIPEVPDFGKKITLRHLANHTSGLRDQWNLLVMAGWRMDDVITTEQVLKLISRQESLNFEPGDEILYSNTGYTLLAEVVTRVSGMSFAEFTEKRIFAPLGMKSSLFYDDHEKIVRNRAYSYEKAGNGYKKSVLSYAIPGATSLFTTTEDLTRWSSNFESPTIGNDETMKTMHTEGVLNNGDSIGYAFGQVIGSFHGLTNYSHGGADAGFRTFISRFPNEKLTVVIFGNEASFDPGNIADQIAEIYIGDKFVEVNNDVEETKKPESEKGIKVKTSILKKYVGDFELQPGFIITISLDGTTLNAQATGQGMFELIPESKTLFATDFEAKISFPNSSSDHVSHLTLYQGGQETKAERLAIIDKATIELSNYTGFYYSDELATGYTIELLNDTLIVSHSKASDFQLSSIKKDTFSSTFWAFGVVEFVRNDSDEIIGIKVSNGRVRNVYLEKR